MNRVLKLVTLCAVVFSLVGTAALPALAKKPGKNAPATASEGGMDPLVQQLIGQVARQPELMNVDYLRYYIGSPENEPYERYNLNHKYYWYDPDHRLLYQLDQVQSVPGQVTEASMTFNLDGMGVTFDQLESFFGKPAKKFFDYNTHPSELFILAPDTMLSFSSQPNTFCVNKAKVLYRGAALPAPSQADMGAAADQLRSQASSAGGLNSLVPGADAITILQQHIKANPQDAEAHLGLARALQKQARLHEAIGEYKVALALSGTNQDVRNAALEVLRSMHIVDDPNMDGPRRDLQLIQSGQRMRAKGTQQTEQPLSQ